jgi:ProP effector
MLWSIFLSLFAAMNLPEKKPLDDARALLKQLEQQFPVFQSAAPLAIGIDKQVIGRLQGVDKKVLRVALGLHTNSTRYLKAMEKAQQRFDLDGNVAGEVTDEHRARASEVLKERFKKIAQQRREKQQEERESARRQEKLQQLAEKFSPRR